MANDALWENISKGLGAEPRDHPVLPGISGLEHTFLGIAVDEARKRVVVYSSDPDPRVAALTQVDVQANMPDMRVLLARPIVVDLGVLSRELVAIIGSDKINLPAAVNAIREIQGLPSDEQAHLFKKFLGGGIERIATAFKHVSLPTISQLITVLQQSANFDWAGAVSAFQASENPPLVALDTLTSIDNLANDRRHGICPLPLYELGEDDWTMFTGTASPAEIRDRLTELGVYQYFFPPLDELALGLIERGIDTETRVSGAVATADRLGHVISRPSLVNAQESVVEVLDQLADQGYIGEGEFGFEVTPAGTSYRANFKVRPKEGVVERISKLLQLKIDPTSLLK